MEEKGGTMIRCNRLGEAQISLWEAVWSGSRFLLPALSPREMGQPGPALELSHTAGSVDRLTKILPLPEGEGRGEGKRGAPNGARAQKQICARLAGQSIYDFMKRFATLSSLPGGGRCLPALAVREEEPGHAVHN
jgi:hypothetical protein